MQETGFFEHNGGSLYYEVTGEGDPILFIHGFALDRRMWEPQVDFFAAQGYRTITYDVRGFGESSLPDGKYRHYDDAQALLDHLQTSPVHVVGLSMGGRIATNLALEHPAVVRSLALLDAALDGQPNTVDWDLRIGELGLQGAKAHRLDHPIFGSTKERPEVRTALDAMMRDYSGWHWLHEDTQHPTSTEALTRLHEINVPALVMVGEHDLPYFHDVAEVYKKELPEVHKVVVPGAGHMVNLESPGVCNSLILAHIALAIA